MCEDRNRLPEFRGGRMGQDGGNVQFTPVGGDAPAPEAFMAKAMNGRVPQQSTKAFSPATIRAQRYDATSPVDHS